MSVTSSYTDTFALAARVRVKLNGQFANKKDENLRMVVAHAQLYDHLDYHLETLRKRRRLNASRKAPREVLAGPNNQYPVRSNHPANSQSNRPGAKISPQERLNPVADHAVEGEENIKPPSRPPGPINYVIVDDTEKTDLNDNTSKRHGSPSLIGTPFTMETNKRPDPADNTSETIVSETYIGDTSDSNSDSDSDSDSDSGFSSDHDPESDTDWESNLDENGDLEMKSHSSAQLSKSIPKPVPRSNPSKPHVVQDHNPKEGLRLSDVIAQDSLKVEDLLAYPLFH
ncbi:MAG: hypothetical protein Q9204_004225 [Flavoplaca sp. TL-2023a]